MQILIQLFWECILFIRFYSVWGKISQELCAVVQNPKNNGEAFYSRTVFLNFGCTLERPGKLLKIQCRPMVIFAPSPLHQLIRIWEDFFSVILPSQSCRNQCPTSLPVPLRVWSKFWFTLQAVVTSGTSIQTKSKGLETFTAI